MNYQSPAHYLPHQPPLLMLETVVAVSAHSAHCRTTVDPRGVLAPFLNPQGKLPGWYALELMAQSIGVWSGWQREQNGEPSSLLGMVLGARNLNCASDQFDSGAKLDIEVKLLMQDQRFGSFDCLIQVGEQIFASGRINTFQPNAEDLHNLFQQKDNLP